MRLITFSVPEANEFRFHNGEPIPKKMLFDNLQAEYIMGRTEVHQTHGGSAVFFVLYVVNPTEDTRNRLAPIFWNKSGPCFIYKLAASHGLEVHAQNQPI